MLLHFIIVTVTMIEEIVTGTVQYTVPLRPRVMKNSVVDVD